MEYSAQASGCMNFCVSKTSRPIYDITGPRCCKFYNTAINKKLEYEFDKLSEICNAWQHSTMQSIHP